MMKKNSLIILFFIAFIQGFAQVPQGINYQAVVRNGNGTPMANAQISVKFSILLNTNVSYSEIHNINTSANGLINLTIGNGTPTPSNIRFDTINWSLGTRHLQISIDTAGGGTILSATTTKLWSVPYALYSHKADTANYVVNGVNSNNIWLRTPITGTPGNVYLNDTADNVGIGTISPSAKLEVKEFNGSQVALKVNNVSSTNPAIHAIQNGNATVARFEQVTSGTGAGPAVKITTGTNGSAGLEVSNSGFGTPTNNYAIIIPPGGGNVGIGTIAPSTKFHVNSGAAHTTAIETIENTAGNYQNFLTTVNPNSVITGSKGDIANDVTNGVLYYKTGVGTNNINWIPIATTGADSSIWRRTPTTNYVHSPFSTFKKDSIGIGTLTPKAKLEVYGTTKLSYNIDQLTSPLYNYVTTIQNTTPVNGFGSGALEVINSGNRSLSNNALFIKDASHAKTGISSVFQRNGIKVEMVDNTSNSANLRTDTTVGISVSTLGAGSPNNYAIKARSNNSLPNSKNYGIYASASGGAANWAGYFEKGNVLIKDSLKIGGGSTSFNNIPGIPGLVTSFVQEIPAPSFGGSFGYVLTNGIKTLATYIGPLPIGSGPFPTGAGIGTVTVDDFHIFTRQSGVPYPLPKMTITSTGNVGIDTIYPKNTLTVNGSIAVRKNHFSPNSSANSYTMSPKDFILEVNGPYNGIANIYLPNINSVDEGTLLIIRNRLTSPANSIKINASLGVLIYDLNNNSSNILTMLAADKAVQLYKSTTAGVSEWVEY